MTPNQIYGNSFVFHATRYEEWCNQRCTRKGNVDSTITAQISGCSVCFRIDGNPQLQMDGVFTLPMTDADDVLADRVQYGRLPMYQPNNLSSSKPIVCNIFFNMTCIRFAMMAPLRIVEFYGSFTN